MILLKVTKVKGDLNGLAEAIDVVGAKKPKRRASPKKEDQHDKHLNTMERLYSQSENRETDVLEVWFAVRLALLILALSLTFIW